MARVKKKTTIAAAPDKVWAYISEPLNMPRFIPGMIDIHDHVGEGVGSHFKWAYKMAGVRFDGESTVEEFVPAKRMVVVSKGGIPSTWTWTLAPQAGGTELNLEVDYSVPVPVLGKLAEPLVARQNDREAELALENLKAQTES